MEKLDRAVQRRILEGLATQYPEQVHATELGFDESSSDWNVNVLYLDEHRLVEAERQTMLSEGTFAPVARITARGMDFLADDGGLGAILNVTTVRFEAATLRELIGDRIDRANLPPEDKGRVKAWLQTAGTEALKETTKRLVGEAIERSPQMLVQLQTLLG
jgi:hypothetical protein